MTLRNTTTHRRVWVSLVAMLVATGGAVAYEEYSDSRNAGKCADCHGNFRSSPYTSLKPGEGSWGDDLHDVHRNDMLNGDCDACHGGLGGSRFPVSTYTSNGGTGLAALGCVGCHGRDDGSGSVTAVGLRQHHTRAGEPDCLDCHDDADPADTTPVGEDILPPYYSTMDTAHPDIPSDPCNPSPAFSEGSFAATTLGLDNDGDDVYDENDSDCGAVSLGPGETTTLVVQSRDDINGSMAISYAHPCDASENTIAIGPLSAVSSYGYNAQECSIGTTGSYDWTYPVGDLFFVIVANNGSIEGSYGLDGGSLERPEDSSTATCPLPQDIVNRCDP